MIQNLAWEFCVPVMENLIPASLVWDAITTTAVNMLKLNNIITKHDL